MYPSFAGNSRALVDHMTTIGSTGPAYILHFIAPSNEVGKLWWFVSLVSICLTRYTAHLAG